MSTKLLRINITLLFLLCYLFLNSQLRIFLTGGINYSNLITILIPPPFDSIEAEHFNYRFIYNGGLSLKYDFKRINLYTGAIISYRGSRSIDLFFNPINGNNVYDFTYTYLEIPILISRYLFDNKAEVGGGLEYSLRVGSNNVTVGDENQIHGMDVKAFIKYNILKNFNIELSYLYGGVDKLILNKIDNYTHSVFAFNLNYQLFKFN